MTARASRAVRWWGVWVGVAAVSVTGGGPPHPYPLEGYEYTGIRRLQAYAMIQDGTMRGNLRLAPGAFLPLDGVRLRLADRNPDFDIPSDMPRDSALQAGLDRIVGARDPSYRVAMLDITDPMNPRYAGIRPDQGYLPGSVGKLLIMTGLFNELHKRFPDDLDARADLLRSTRIAADEFVIPNSHAVPVVNDEMTAVTHRAIRVGDTFTLWEWVDHMVSPSSNAAGSMVWKHVLLLSRFGPAYPPDPTAERDYLTQTAKADLTALASRVIDEPLAAAGIDTTALYQRTLFTRTAQRAIPGAGSSSTPRQLLRWLVKLEQGRLVDRWSSLEMKRLMYFTRRRYRYSASPALAEAAVYFKSGSLYQCRPEPDYECGQYRGNRMNLMHSVAIVETSPDPDGRQRVYLISMMSNVLKVNSAAEHAEIAARIDRLVRERNP